MNVEQENKTIHCSNCKKDILENVYQIHEAHCIRNIVLCQICQEPVPRVQLQEHYEENHTEAPCDLCGRKFAKDQLDAHKEEDCLQRKIPCEYCQLDIKAIEFQEHATACGSRTDVCDKCLQRVMLRDMETHHKTECGKPRPQTFEPRLQTFEPRPNVTNPYRFNASFPSGLRPTGAVAMGGAVGNIGGLPVRGHTSPIVANVVPVQYYRRSSSEEHVYPVEENTRSNLLIEQLEMEEEHEIKGMPTMMIYNLSMEKSKQKKQEQLKQIQQDELFAKQLQDNDTLPTQYTDATPVVKPLGNVPIIPLDAIMVPGHVTVADDSNVQEHLMSDEEFAQKLQLEEDENTKQLLKDLYNTATTPPSSPTHSPPTRSPTVPYMEVDEEEEEPVIPCEICNQQVHFELYQYHMKEEHPAFANVIDAHSQRYYGSGHRGNSSPTIRSTTTVVPPYTRVNETAATLDDDEETHIYCQYCGFPFSSNVMEFHETICDNNPEKNLKNVRNTSITPTYEPLTSSAGDETETTDGLPCQFCNKLFPFDVFERHQRSCDDRFLPHNLERDNLFGTRGNRDTPISLDGVESNYETCPNCNESILTTGMYLHKMSCRSNTYREQQHYVKPSSAGLYQTHTNVNARKELTDYRKRLEEEQRKKLSRNVETDPYQHRLRDATDANTQRNGAVTISKPNYSGGTRYRN